jgi:pimeloyl-ACP methyl ester carboxylesterase
LKRLIIIGLSVLLLCIFLIGLATIAPSNTVQATIAQVTATPRPFRLEDTACPADFASDAAVVCKTLVVPEDRTKPDGRQIRIAVGVARAKARTPQADPVFYLHGGPSMGSLYRVRWWPYSPFRDERDVIVMDQRGAGFSTPALDCPEMDTLPAETLINNRSLDDGAQLHIAAALACSERLTKEGIDLTQYTNKQIAEDVDDLRQALGYDQINLFAWSAGTRTALYTMRAHPETIRAAILDSVYMPPGVDYYTNLAPNAAKSFEALFAACAADVTCTSKYGDLRALFNKTVDQLQANPARFKLLAPINGQTDAEMNGQAFVGLLYRLLYEAYRIGAIPGLIAEVSTGNYEALPALLQAPLTEAKLYRAAMNHSVYCLETAPYVDKNKLLTSTQSIDLHYRGFYHWDFDPLALVELCPKWPQPAVKDDMQTTPIKGDIPTLIFAGTFDPASPPADGKYVAGQLSRSYFYEFPTMGHFVWEYGRDCPKEISLGFLNSPERAPDTACIKDMQPIVFTGNGIASSGAETGITRRTVAIAAGVVGAVGVTGAAIWFVARRARLRSG